MKYPQLFHLEHLVGFEGPMVNEQYEMYQRCGICCLPGPQWEDIQPEIFMCLACSHGERRWPIPFTEWWGLEAEAFVHVVRLA